MKQSKRELRPAFIRRLSNHSYNRKFTNLYSVPIPFTICPFCEETLEHDTAHQIPLGSENCVFIHGTYCESCDSFFSDDHQILNYLATLPHDLLPDSTVYTDYQSLYDSQVKRSPVTVNSHFLYVCVLLITSDPLDLKLVQVVTDPKLEDTAKGIYYYETITDLLAAIAHKEKFVELDGYRYIVEHLSKNQGFFLSQNAHISAFIKSACEVKYNRPELSTLSTLYIYKGQINCERNHHVVPYKASISALDLHYRFLVHYCYSCHKFIMKYDDYKDYLRRYHFFPLKTHMEKDFDDYIDNFQARSEFSPLSMMGYTVRADSGLNTKMRQAILAYALDHSIIKQRILLNYLEMFIRDSERRPDRALAVSKWKEDQEFVLNYNLSEKPQVIIGTLTQWS